MVNNDFELNVKIDNFIDWYKVNKVVEFHKKEIFPLEKLRNFIEKMAVWYELRYPTCEINRIMPCASNSINTINEEIFENNPYIKEYTKSKNTLIYYNEFKNIIWSKFYNIDVFIKSLDEEEKKFLMNPKYPDIIYLNEMSISSSHVHLDEEGYVTDFENCSYLKKTNGDKTHINDIVELLKKQSSRNLYNKTYEKLFNTIENYKKDKYFKEELLNCVMYRIIERGGDRIGPRRGLLFAKEFNRNIEIPMIYGIDYTDSGLYNFIDEYLKLGGRRDLTCVVGYGTRKKDTKLSLVNLDSIILNMNIDYDHAILLKKIK